MVNFRAGREFISIREMNSHARERRSTSELPHALRRARSRAARPVIAVCVLAATRARTGHLKWQQCEVAVESPRTDNRLEARAADHLSITFGGHLLEVERIVAGERRRPIVFRLRPSTIFAHGATGRREEVCRQVTRHFTLRGCRRKADVARRGNLTRRCAVGRRQLTCRIRWRRQRGWLGWHCRLGLERALLRLR